MKKATLAFIIFMICSKWNKQELKNAQERSLQNDNNYILPLRLNDVPIPGLYTTIAYIDYNHLMRVKSQS